uniref:hypothetical protein n=1 Tax=Madagascaria erythrocladioides TaxID=753684 RepID=UPI001FCCC85E|nr:hypothetical protein MW574_mgp06 [Madagascaria erythrocladioides]UNJ18791.1 hypothetical protein [Madagascaria erythrocladioides]
MPRLKNYHHNILFFDYLTQFNITHPSYLKSPLHIKALIESNSFPTEKQNAYVYLALKWIFGQQLKVLKTKNYIFTLHIRTSNSYNFLDQLFIFSLIKVNHFNINNFFFNNFLKINLQNIGSIFEFYCKLNLNFEVFKKLSSSYIISIIKK